MPMTAYEARVRELIAEGMTNSDAQAIAGHEGVSESEPATMVQELAEALRTALARLDTIGTRASCAPNDDEALADQALTTIMRDAYGMRDTLRAALARYDNERNGSDKA